jgi:hypothetical protein
MRLCSVNVVSNAGTMPGGAAIVCVVVISTVTRCYPGDDQVEKDAVGGAFGTSRKCMQGFDGKGWSIGDHLEALAKMRR